MDQVKKSDIPPKKVQGGLWYNVFGSEDTYIKSDEAFMAYGCFSPKHGIAVGCFSAGEVFYVVETRGTAMVFGKTAETMENRIELKKGMILRAHEKERCRFNFLDLESYAEIIIFSVNPKLSFEEI